MPTPARDHPVYLTSPRQIRTLRSVVRQQIVDVVGVIGPCTVAELADALGRSADGLYFHVKQLLAVGLLHVADPADSAHLRGQQVDVPGRPLFIHYDLSSPRARDAIATVAASMLRTASRQFQRALARSDAVGTGNRRNLWSTRIQAQLTEQDREQLNAILQTLITFMATRPRKQHGTMHALTFTVSPVQVSPRAGRTARTRERQRK